MTQRVWDVVWCLIYGTGVVLFLGAYGIQQERIMSLPYSNRVGASELFRYSVFLVFLNRICACLFAFTMAFSTNESLQPQVSVWKYMLVSLSNVSATTCQYESLKWVPFTLQMLGKSCKMLPVMIWGILISRKAYSRSDWMVAAAVTGGVAWFVEAGDGNVVSARPQTSDNTMYGCLLLLGFLVADGFTSTFQEKLFKDENTSKYNQMFYVNLGSALISFTILISANQLYPSILFLMVYPQFLMDAITISFAAVGAQFCIFSQVEHFGALVFAATMNVRQLTSIMLSYATYGHHITVMQIVGLIIVFMALFYRSFAALRWEDEKSTERANLLPSMQNLSLKKTALV